MPTNKPGRSFTHRSKGTLTICGPDGKTVLKVASWDIKLIVRSWYNQWIRRMPRG